MISENIYGHAKRLHWISSFLNPSDRIVELGCGTGCMISLPLAKMGYDIFGIDLHNDSITYGQEIFRKEGLDPDRLKPVSLSEFAVMPDVIIASEVLEHLNQADLLKTLEVIRSKLKRGGMLLVTVPNGYGWFEMESFLWFKTGLGWLIEKLRIGSMVHIPKKWLFGWDIDYPHPSTLANSPHVQRFTCKSIQKLLRSHGFKVMKVGGSVLLAGPFSGLLFTGIKPVMKLNCLLGDLFPNVASAFYIACQLQRR